MSSRDIGDTGKLEPGRPGVVPRGMICTDEQYVDGGFDTRTVWGYNFSIIGPPREFGAGISVRF